MNHHTRVLRFLLLVPLLSALLSTSTPAANITEPEPISLEGLTSSQVDSVLATLSDKEVRSLFTAEIAKDVLTDVAGEKEVNGGGIIKNAAGWLHLLDTKGSKDIETPGFSSYLLSIPGDVLSVARKIGDGSLTRSFFNIILLVVVFVAAYFIKFLIQRLTADFRRQFQEKAIPDLDGPMRFLAGILNSIPVFIDILVYSAAAVLLFFLLPGADHAPLRYLFLALLFVTVFVRIINQLSQIICSPHAPSLRVIPVTDATAASLHKGVLLLGTYTFAVIMLLALLVELQLNKTTLNIIAIVGATLLNVLIIYGILRNRTAVQEYLLNQSEQYKTRNWVVEKFAQFWHVPTILYLIIVLIFLVNDLFSGVEQERSAFLPSLLVLPLFVLFDSVGQWVVRTSIINLRIYNPDAEEHADEDMKLKLTEDRERERTIAVTFSRIVRLAILAALLIWAGSLWGYNIPYVSKIAGAVFESLVTLALGLTAWSFASSYIEQKISEAIPEEEEEEDGQSDNEFGGAAQRGRSYTLLPLLRKFIATTLLVMVTLVILSAFGIDIGPLLAGAGVIGLAVGFGAQKLVSDVFSGFFYLLDDAFRVGEYIQAGSVSGAVESITLRNVMLRHHRGMLQIVPHSDLGSITNFMRGGLVIKFNLEFPYDTDIDLVRRIIKKVGQAMLEDEEIGKDFIHPVKSQGVREISGSVMVIRVKFTAQPGTQFVIQREAYRRISEALNAKGIFYAHRKVIVELPRNEKSTTPDENEHILEVGAAAALAQIEEEKKKAATKGSSDSGMPGM